MNAAVVIANPDMTWGDLFDATRFACNFDDVAFAYLILHEKKQAGTKIPDQTLCPESYCYAGHSGGRERRSNRYTEFAEND